jgi:pilus assembly protein CpaE
VTLVQAITALLAVDASFDRALVDTALPNDVLAHGIGHGAIVVAGVVEGLEQRTEPLQEHTADVLVVACADSSDLAVPFINRAVRERPERPVVVLSSAPPNGFLRHLFELGVDDVIVLPDSAERVAFALEKAVARKHEGAAATGAPPADLICVLGPKGGTGKTLTSANLAVALAAEGRTVAVVDLDLQFGDLGLALGLRPKKTIYDLATSAGSLDSEKLEAYLVSHSSGAQILLAPTRPDEAGFISVELLREIYSALRFSHEFVIVDTPPGFTREVIVAIDNSTGVCMVGTLDALSLKNTKLGLETLERMGYDPARVCLVLNRADTDVGISRADVEAILGRPPDVFVPSSRDIPRSVNDGTPIVLAQQQSQAAAAFRSLCAVYLPVAVNRDPNGNGHRPGASSLRSIQARLSRRH